MAEQHKEIIPITIEEELKRSYMDYAMSVIVARALPDVRDGLKPVHRRALFAMNQLNNDWNKPHKKSARIVGDVIGKYHPHGDTAVYDTIVRMAQPFSLRYPMVDGQGNFGSIDGDSPAAMRYTEIRLSRIAHTMLEDLEKETVDFAPNYDETEQIPTVLPARLPNLLVNGASGIAVGMATNIPPHNLGEVINACLAMIDNPEIKLDGLIKHVPGPDFPTAGIINGRAGILQAYRTGRGKILIRAKTNIEQMDKGGKQAIIVDELPYQVNKARLQERIGELVKARTIEGITAIRDESDKDGMRLVIELRRGEIAEVVLNNLFAHTQIQVVYGINIVALDRGQPKQMNLPQLLNAFLRHRREVVTRRTVFDLAKARDRAHILEGYGIALANIDEVVAMIKASPSPAEAKERLLAKMWVPGSVMEMLERTGVETTRPEWLDKKCGLIEGHYQLSPEQAQAILELRLHRLTGLEQDRIFKEYNELIELINSLLEILSDPDRLMQVIRDELLEIKERFGDKRRTEIIEAQEEISHEDLITEENVVVTLSHEGYAKTQTMDTYQTQRRGGRGKAATQMKAEDYVAHLLIANTHDTVLCFSNRGKVYWLKVYNLPQGTRASRGRPLVNLLPLGSDERINAILPIRDYASDRSIFMSTARGLVKKVGLNEFSRPRASGIIALELKEDDRLVDVAITDGDQEVLLFADTGKAVRFHEGQVRAMGRTARGVRGMQLKKDQQVISLIIVQQGGAILTATENGYGKRTSIVDYPRANRGGMGVISIQVTKRNGKAVGATQVFPENEIMLISNRGTLVRMRVDEISMVGRNTQGVRLINLNKGEKLVGLQRIEEVELVEE